MEIRRIALVVGDTAGHFYPALAVAEAYARRAAGVEVVLFGPRGVGRDLAARHGYSYQEVTTSQIARVGMSGRVAAAGRTLAGIAPARLALRALASRLVVGFGSHASGTVVLAARSLGLRTAIHEGNVRPGIANRLLARVTDRVYVGHGASAGAFPPHRARLAGWPVRSQVLSLADRPREPRSGARPARVLVCSGSRGGAFMAREAPAMLARVARSGLRLDVLHQAEAADPGPIRDAYARAGIGARVSPRVDDMAAAYDWADVAIARAGAGTIAELAIVGLPSLLVPLADAAADHQSDNAAVFAAGGAALWTRERDWDGPALADRLVELLGDAGRWAAMSAAARRLAAPDAADRVVDDCEDLMRGRW